MNVDVLFYAPSLRLEKALLQFNYEGVRAVVFAETGNDATETVTMLIFDGNTGYVGKFLAGLVCQGTKAHQALRS